MCKMTSLKKPIKRLCNVSTSVQVTSSYFLAKSKSEPKISWRALFFLKYCTNIWSNLLRMYVTCLLTSISCPVQWTTVILYGQDKRFSSPSKKKDISCEALFLHKYQTFCQSIKKKNRSTDRKTFFSYSPLFLSSICFHNEVNNFN